jgi:DNA-binding transcriptional MerR regulator
MDEPHVITETDQGGLMKIGDLVRQSGLTERMLRHYEQLGIIAPQRSERGTRYYSRLDLGVARLAHLFRELEIPLETIASIANERRAHMTGDKSGAAIGHLLDDLAGHLAEKARKSLSLHRVITEASKAVKSCHGCRNKPGPTTCPDCPLNDVVHQNAMAAMIWRDG